MTKQEKEKLNKFREWLVSETEKYQKRSTNSNASDCGKHYDRGQANGLILARGELEKTFGL
jgi:hypothetical protein